MSAVGTIFGRLPRGQDAAHVPYAQFLPTRGIVHTLLWQFVGLGALGLHLLLIRELGPPAFPLVPLLMALLYTLLPLAGLIVFLQVLLYQGWMISALLTPGVPISSFQVMQATGFVAVGMLALVATFRLLTGRKVDHARARRLTWMTIAVVGVVLAYTALGAVASSPASAATYFRNCSAMLLALLIGLDLGRIWGYETVARALLISTVFGVVLTGAEIADPHAYYDTFNVPTFYTMKYGAQRDPPTIFHTADDVIAFHKSALFNVTGTQAAGGLTSVRYGGPNMHAISYAYVVAVAGIVAVSLGQPLWLLVFFPVLMMLGTKGAVILLVVACGLNFLWRQTGRRTLLIRVGALFSIAYVSFGLWYGLRHGDFHAIGFMGGVRGLMHKPWGHGIGVGGNLSTLAAGSLVGMKNWLQYQNAGAADFATESAVGVLIYQMGVGSLALLALFVSVLRSAPIGEPTQAGRTLRSVETARAVGIVFIALGVVLVNGVFQEEAYSPYGLGLLTLLAGVATTNAFRPTLDPYVPARYARPDRLVFEPRSPMEVQA